MTVMHWFCLSPIMKVLQFYIIVLFLCVCVCYGRTHVGCGAFVEVRGPLVGVSSLLLYLAPSDQTQVIKLGAK